MADDKNKKDFRDRDKVAGGESYEVDYLAKELNVSVEEIQEAIKAVGNDRAKIEEYINGKGDME